MKFGALYISDYYPERYKSASHYYGEMMEQIQYEEELGFDSVLFAEHYVGGYAFPSPPVFAAAVAQKTKRIRLGTGVTLLPLNNPIRIAEEYAMVDVLSDGRLDFGVGRGVLKSEYDLFDINESESQGRFHESLEIILQAWTQETVSYAGKYYKI
ncbi:MAG: LLM class flavin-dependent oxidoreductase, partial [Deltaproteobacteria bacterium]|nr:LLM class flavin-dependent oxidoreductase [Deltaproteobacteria bacterium]